VKISERRQHLILLLQKQPVTTLTELAGSLAVPTRTIRRDLQALVLEEHPIRICNNEVSLERGNTIQSDNSFAQRLRVNETVKRSIARWAAGLVENGTTIVLDASSTVYYLAGYLRERRNLTILTNGIEVGRCLAENTSNTVVLIGGVIRPDGASVTGHMYEPLLKNYRIKTAFVSCTGFSLAAGLTEKDLHEATLKNKMVTSAESTVALIDSIKFGRVDLMPFARSDQISHIFSDGNLEPYWAEQVQKASIVLTICR
jgi:DeoR/GlpR family transcriptional regulator of sugar metabolism